MKKTVLLTQALTLWLTALHPAMAITADGSDGNPSSFILSVYDPDTRQTYYTDLNLNYLGFLSSPSAEIDLGNDPDYAGFKGKPNLRFNVAAFSGLQANNANSDTWGILLTSSVGPGIFRSDWVGIDAVRQVMQIYFSYLTGNSAVLNAGTAGAFNSNQWNDTLWGKVGGSTTAGIGLALPFYYVSNPAGDPAGGFVRKAGEWTLGNDGLLRFSGGHSLRENQIPVASAGVDFKAASNKAITLNGSASQDPDLSPKALTYQWTQTAGPGVTLTNPTLAQPSFTPMATGNYSFRLTVSDGSDAVTDDVTVTVKPVVIFAPVNWKAGQQQSIRWDFDPKRVTVKQTLSVGYSKDNRSYRALGAPKSILGLKAWKPLKTDASAAGTLRICASRIKLFPMVCDTVAVQVVK